jgi:hypothetical protein
MGRAGPIQYQDFLVACHVINNLNDPNSKISAPLIPHSPVAKYLNYYGLSEEPLPMHNLLEKAEDVVLSWHEWAGLLLSDVGKGWNYITDNVAESLSLAEFTAHISTAAMQFVLSELGHSDAQVSYVATNRSEVIPNRVLMKDKLDSCFGNGTRLTSRQICAYFKSGVVHNLNGKKIDLFRDYDWRLDDEKVDRFTYCRGRDIFRWVAGTLTKNHEDGIAMQPLGLDSRGMEAREMITTLSGERIMYTPSTIRENPMWNKCPLNIDRDTLIDSLQKDLKQ